MNNNFGLGKGTNNDSAAVPVVNFRIGSDGGTVAYTSGTSITLGGTYPTIPSSASLVYVKVVPLSGATTYWVAGVNGVKLTISGAVITITGAGTAPFTAGDVYEVGVNVAVEYDIDIARVGGETLVADNGAGASTTKPLPTGGKYNATPPVYASGDVAMTQMDANGNTKVYDASPTVQKQPNYGSPYDFTATYTSANTITITGAPFTVDDANCMVTGIIYKPTAGTSLFKLENGKNGIVITSAANLITVLLNGVAFTGFASGDTYRVAIDYQCKAYDPTTDSNKSAEIAPLNSKYQLQTLVDTTNVAAADNYYPSAAGLSMDGFKDITIMGKTAGGVTTTIEATIDDAASPDWIDITLAGYDLLTNAVGTASFVDVDFMLDFSNLNVCCIRIKSVTSDATNAVQYNVRQKAL